MTPARLPNADQAVIDERKFTAYSMDPANPRNEGKWEAWTQLGYDLDTRRGEAATDVSRQLRHQLPDAPISGDLDTAFGPRRSTRTTVIGPNGRAATLVCVWQYDHGSTRPRMITNWLEVHTERSE